MRDRKEIESDYKLRDNRERENLVLEVLLDIRDLLQAKSEPHSVVINTHSDTNAEDVKKAVSDALNRI